MNGPAPSRAASAGLTVLCALLAACAADAPQNAPEGMGVDAIPSFTLPDRDAGDGPRDADTERDARPADDVHNADADDRQDAGDPPAETYANLCASCHGNTGQGGTGPALVGWDRSRAILVDAIDSRMPQADPSLCSGTCATALADYVLGWAGDDTCDTIAPTAPALRLLTPDEYDATLRDLIGGQAAACAAWADCDARRESCTNARCEPLACDTQGFVFDPAGANYRTVHVAGSFNGWPGTLADGGWALTYDAAQARWRGSFAVGEGRHEYKLVLDERDWVADAGNPDASPDGFGGNNSVIVRDCSIGADNAAWSTDLPQAVRPEGFPFTTHAEASNVGASHLETYLRNGPAIADVIVSRWAPAIGCSGGSACAEGFVRDFGQAAFRRPLSDDERARYAGLVTSASSFEDGLRRAVEQFLISPHFLYRFERGTSSERGKRLSSWEIASVLSYALWGSMPDERLFADAAAGALDTDEGVERAARWMLDDPRARAGIERFAEQWLGIESVATMVRDEARFPAFTDAARAAVQEETRRLVSHVVFDGTGRFPELFTADYTFANAALGALYGFDTTEGTEVALVAYPDDRRSGVLGHASVLGATAHSDQTSPIRRGLWVRQRVLCQEFGPPPANAGGVPEVDPTATTRERFRQHTDDPFCSSCHQYIDDLGFGFEAFDSVGQWRTTDGAFAVDARGNLNDVEGFGTGTDARFDTLPGVAEVIVASESARRCFVRQYTRYVRGRLETPEDRCALDAIDDAFVAADLNIREMMIAVVTDPGLLYRQ